MVTLDREWVAPGRMGWFGVSSDSTDDRNDYARKVDEYVRGLPADAVLVMLDCHI